MNHAYNEVPHPVPSLLHLIYVKVVKGFFRDKGHYCVNLDEMESGFNINCVVQTTYKPCYSPILNTHAQKMGPKNVYIILKNDHFCIKSKHFCVDRTQVV